MNVLYKHFICQRLKEMCKKYVNYHNPILGFPQKLPFSFKNQKNKMQQKLKKLKNDWQLGKNRL